VSDVRTVNLVLVHGAWHTKSSWFPLQSVWIESSIVLSALDLPSVDGTGDLSRDAAALVKHCQQIDGPIILLGHSYGGAVITQAAVEVSSLVGLIYLAALKPSLGESVSDQNRQSPVQSSLNSALVEKDGQLVLDVERALPLLYESSHQSLDDIVASMHHQSVATFTEKISVTLPEKIATTYLLCQRDQIVPPSLQGLIAASCGHLEELPCGHCPNVDAPLLLRDRIEREVRRMTNKSAAESN
jgi:pimeloyl-ACP methyl ester carboxylesterase